MDGLARMSDVEAGDDWTIDTDNPFIGMRIHVTTDGDRDDIDGEIVAI